MPLMIGFGLAFGGLPFYRSTIFACHIQNPPTQKTWYPLVFLTFVPIFSAILFTTVMMIQIYLKVSMQSKRSSKWTFPNFRLRQEPPVKTKQRRSFVIRRESSSNMQLSSSSNCRKSTRGGSLERAVFVQSLFYLFAFYFCWLFLFAAHLKASPSLPGDRTSGSAYAFFVATFAIAPLQGFWNCCVYFRPRMVARWSAKYGAKRPRSSPLTPSSTATIPYLRAYFRSRTSNYNSDDPESEGERALDTRPEQSDDNEPCDPSTAIALLDASMNSSTSTNRTIGITATVGGNKEAELGGESDIGVTLDAIREELEQLDVVKEELEQHEGNSAHQQLEEFSEDGTDEIGRRSFMQRLSFRSCND